MASFRYRPGRLAISPALAEALRQARLEHDFDLVAQILAQAPRDDQDVTDLKAKKVVHIRVDSNVPWNVGDTLTILDADWKAVGEADIEAVFTVEDDASKKKWKEYRIKGK